MLLVYPSVSVWNVQTEICLYAFGKKQTMNGLLGMGDIYYGI